LRAWSERVQAGGGRIGSCAFTTGGLQRAPFFTLLQGMYDQQMAHNDFQLGRLVDRLKASGEWQNTLLVVTADHSIAGSFTDTRAGMLDSLPPPWSRLLLRPTVSRVPLLVVWPGHISGGQRFDDPVSLIDVLPTVLDLVGLPRPDVMQGQSLAPLLLGRPGWTPHPVILDEFNIDRETGRVQGRLEIVDGQWGASLWIGPPPADTLSRRPWPLLLYDLWNDPFALQPINEERSDLVERYTAFLEQQWKDHQALATRFKAGEQVVLTPDQLERLRALGYIR
jgi:arylsulfatase A-like enzyme